VVVGFGGRREKIQRQSGSGWVGPGGTGGGPGAGGGDGKGEEPLCNRIVSGLRLPCCSAMCALRVLWCAV
jgi:hypothetical protein